MQDVELIPGKWYTTKDWLSEPSMCKLIKIEKDEGYILLYHLERVSRSEYYIRDTEDYWCSRQGYFEVDQHTLNTLLPADHPDVNIPDIKDVLKQFLQS